MQVPKFEGYFPSESDMDRKQLVFYKRLESKLENGEYLDIYGNIGYVFVYLYKLLSQWNKKGFERLSEYLIYISELYKSEEKLSNYCLFWAYDCLLGLQEYEEYLDKTEPNQAFGTSTHTSNLRLNIQKKIGLPADPVDILLMAGGRKTKFIVKNEALYKDKIREVFEKYTEENGDWFSIFDQWQPKGNTYSHSLFNGAPLCDKPELEFKIEAFYTAYDGLDNIQVLSKKAENLAREESGVPKIGEGWVSETELFQKLVAEFSLTKLVQHGHPNWLVRQHFDIWLPNWKIAVEYHGKQHFEPVDFFGGAEAFEETVERDKRKVNLAKRHGVKLFVITEEDNQDELIQKIHSIIEKRRVLLPKA